MNEHIKLVIISVVLALIFTLTQFDMLGFFMIFAGILITLEFLSLIIGAWKGATIFGDALGHWSAEQIQKGQQSSQFQQTQHHQYNQLQGSDIVKQNQYLPTQPKQQSQTHLIKQPSQPQQMPTPQQTPMALSGTPPMIGLAPKWDVSVRSSLFFCPLCKSQGSIHLRMFGNHPKLICSNCIAEWKPQFGPFDSKVKNMKLTQPGNSPQGQRFVNVNNNVEWWKSI